MRQIFLCMLLGMGCSANEAGAQLRAVPLTGISVAYVMERYSVLSPQGKDWFELKRDKQNVYFGKKLASRTHSFIATAMSVTIDEKFLNPEQFHDYVSKMLTLRGDERHTVIENRVELDNTLGRFCVRYYTKAEDRDAIYAKGKSLLTETSGISCLHPEQPGLSIDVSYTERGYPAESSADIKAEGESFVRSLKFTSR